MPTLYNAKQNMLFSQCSIFHYYLKHKTLPLDPFEKILLSSFYVQKQFQVTTKLYLRKYTMEPQFFTCFCKTVGTVLTKVLAINLTNIEIAPFSLDHKHLRFVHFVSLHLCVYYITKNYK